MQTEKGSIEAILKKVPTSTVTVTKCPLPLNPGHACHLGRRMETRQILTKGPIEGLQLSARRELKLCANTRGMWAGTKRS